MPSAQRRTRTGIASNARSRGRSAIAGLLVALLAGFAVPAARAADTAALRPGASHAVRLAPGEHASYRISLPRGRSALLSIRQQDGMLHLRARAGDADDSPLLQTQAGRAAMLRVYLVAEAASSWDVDVAAAKPERAVSFTVELGAEHATRAGDRDGAKAERFYAEAEALRRAAGGVEGGRGSGDVDVARRRYREAASLWTHLGDACAALRAGSGLARLELAQARYPQAQAAAERALAHGCDATDPAFDAERAVARRTLAAALGYQGEFETSAEQSERALALYRRTGDRRFEGVALGNLSAVYRSLGETHKALQAAADALRIAQETGDAQGVEFSRSNLASSHLARGEFGSALAVYRQTLDELRATPYPLAEGLAWNELGSLYQRLGERGDARAAWTRAHAVWSSSGNRSGAAETWIAQGGAALDEGDTASAEAAFAQAAQIARADGLRSLEAHALCGLGRVAAAANDGPTARARLRESLALATVLRETAAIVAAEQALGDLDLRERNWASARAHYGRALSQARRGGDASAEAAAGASLARVDAATGKPAAAQASIERALAIVESQRAAIADPGLRTAFFASQHEYYALAIDVEMALERRTPRKGHAERALEIAERARARSLLDLLAERSIGIEREVDPALLAQEREAADRQRRLAWRLARTPQAQAGGLRDEVAAALRDLDTARGRLRAASPRYAAIAHPAPLRVDRARADLLGADEAIFEFWLGQTQSYLWVLRADGLESYELPPRAQIAGSVRALLDGVTTTRRVDAGVPLERRAALDAESEAAVRRLASALAQQVFPPALRARWPRQAAIVADAELQGVPFALLADELVDGERPAPVLLPSIAALRSLRELPERHSAGAGAAILADPVFAPDDPRLQPRRDASVRRPAEARDAAIAGLPRLLASRAEAQAIAALASSERSWLALDFAASREAAMRADWSAYAFAHFATHAVLDARHPQLSGIVLSLYDEAGRAQDGFLRVDDLYALRMPVELVTLGACDSAQGADLPGEGVLSLARAFFYAGTRRVVANLWSVDDRASAAFMHAFYRHLLQGGLRPPQALARAQEQLRQNPRFASAYYWSGFVLQGDWR
ncbi:CHAT domain-containing tetratricopeptide repeat protein [Dokdonella ginsengisoli]|uniref:CHAT domain-containing protein n=1 Tax=Dokdonella ginsengisoli TaxID=363846 RepID=A0ABV9QV15_9GAMM